MPAGPTILHADLDAFYASVEQLLDPALRGVPIAVGGSASGGVVLAASYEAKKFGVSGGMPGWRARQLCPAIRFVRGHFSEYQRLADAVMDVLHDITPDVERISIDEAFLDVSGAAQLFGPPAQIGRHIRDLVRDQIGLPISVGAARTKHLAKIASQVAKPDGLVVVEAGDERRFLGPLPVSLMWGVGPVAQQRLAERGIFTIGELAATPSASIEKLLGTANGAKLTALAADQDPRRVATSSRARSAGAPPVGARSVGAQSVGARSVGAQSAMGRRSPEPVVVREVLGHLAERIGSRLRAKDRAGRTVTVRIRFAGMRAITRSRTLSSPLAATLTLTEIAEQLVWKGIGEQPDPHAEISLLAISVSNLAPLPAVQIELPVPPEDSLRPGSAAAAARWAVDRSMDAVRTRFGRDAVGYLPATLKRSRGVPDEFRELAEKDL